LLNNAHTCQQPEFLLQLITIWLQHIALNCTILKYFAKKHSFKQEKYNTRKGQKNNNTKLGVTGQFKVGEIYD